MNSFGNRLLRALTAISAFTAIQAGAAPVVYTLQTVGDGRIGSYVFGEALITVQVSSDTRWVQKAPGPNGGTLFVNRQGDAQITIADAARTTTAHLPAGTVFVYYDTGNGIAGIGSAISPTYPFALGCSNYTQAGSYTRDCVQGDWQNVGEDNGILAALADPGAVGGVTPQTLALPKSLSQSTLLTGRTHSCAGTYTIPDGWDLVVCAAPAPAGLPTDQGDLYLQDQIGGSNPGVGPYTWGMWDTSNVGYLHVEVMSSGR